MPTAIVVHGGAGPAQEDDDVSGLKEGCLAAARRGHEVLARGGSALDAVEAAVVALEDDPRFNAGVGSTLNEAGQVEMDASVMDGATTRAGAVAAVHTVKNPVRLARAVMEKTLHVLLVAHGAEAFADEVKAPRADRESFVTERMRRKFEAARAAPPRKSHGTVGAVALDAQGRLAAATSTGGTFLKRVGRVGDTPIPGAGTYADARGAASATGHGESILRAQLTRRVCDHLAAGKTAGQAAALAIAELETIHGEAGVIVVDAAGRLGIAFNTERMSRAWVTAQGQGAAHGREESNIDSAATEQT